MRQTIAAKVDRTMVTMLASVGMGAAGVGVATWAQLTGHNAGRGQALVFGAALLSVLLAAALAGHRQRIARVAHGDRLVRAERQRIAHDLHDGLSQDLAVIVAYADRLSRELGQEHPVAIAARRALAVARGTMIDLAASAEPTTLDALRAVADEVQSRYPVRIEVRGPAPSCSQQAEPEPEPDDRHDIVRIAREAMVNAVRHGRARRISVIFGEGEREVLRVIDDGDGFTPGRSTLRGTGLGLSHMRGRADRLGAQVVMARRETGGTEVRVRA